LRLPAPASLSHPELSGYPAQGLHIARLNFANYRHDVCGILICPLLLGHRGVASSIASGRRAPNGNFVNYPVPEAGPFGCGAIHFH
jgi:hypothetical protein